MPMGIVLAVGIYVIAQMALSLWAARGVKDAQDYYLAGRRLGPLALAMSLFATWFGAETVMGSSAAIAEEGLAGARAEPFGYALCLVLMALLIAGKLRDGDYWTLADFIRARFGVWAEKLAALVTIPASLFWGAAQLLALGSILAALFGAPVGLTLAIAAGIVILYASFGGFAGDVATDVLQGAVLLICVAGLGIALILNQGGIGPALAAINPQQLTLVGAEESALARLDAWMVPILGSLVTQEAIARFLGARSVSVARRACLLAAGIYLVAGMAPVLFGLVGASIPGAAVGEDTFLPFLARDLLPSVMMVALIGALISAILSTVDSNLLTVSALATRNLGLRSQSGGATLERGLTIAAGLACWALAASGEGIYGLIELSSSIGQSGLLVATLFGLWTRWGDERAALAAMAAGGAVNLWTNALQPLLAPELTLDAPFMASVAASLAAFLVFAALRKAASAPVAAGAD